MARAVAHQGHLKQLELKSGEGENISTLLTELYHFIDHYRAHPKTLHSFTLHLTEKEFQDFELFEKSFWQILEDLKKEDRKEFGHDPRVSENPLDPHFSYSLKEEAFFILTLHPQSPRWSRRFNTPTIVFNPHQQFEDLRREGRYLKVCDIIRRRDKLLQGDINPMLSDFGTASEIYQYMGRRYAIDETINHLQ